MKIGANTPELSIEIAQFLSRATETEYNPHSTGIVQDVPYSLREVIGQKFSGKPVTIDGVLVASSEKPLVMLESNGEDVFTSVYIDGKVKKLYYNKKYDVWYYNTIMWDCKVKRIVEIQDMESAIKCALNIGYIKIPCEVTTATI